MHLKILFYPFAMHLHFAENHTFHLSCLGLGGTVSAGNGKPDPSQEPPR